MLNGFLVLHVLKGMEMARLPPALSPHPLLFFEANMKAMLAFPTLTDVAYGHMVASVVGHVGSCVQVKGRV